MGYGTFGTGTTTIEDGATLEITKTNYNGSYPTWYSYGIITINEGANLSIINNYSGITTSNYNIYFSGSSSGLILNKPNRLILYNKVANVLYASTTIPFSFSFNRINLFNNVIDIDSSISLSTLPNYTWYKNSETSVISGTFNATSTTITNNNFTEEELATLPALSNFIFPNKKIFSLGDFSFNVNALTDKDTKIMGITKPNTSILIQYNNLNEITVADEKGEFSYTYDEALPIGTQITFQSKLSNELIYHTKVIEIVYSGELIIDSATEKVTFLLEPISIIPLLWPKTNELKVTITDSRVNSSNWKLYATINHDLASNDGQILEKSLVFKDNDGTLITLTNQPTLVYTGENNDGNIKVTEVLWKADEGILLRIIDYIENNTQYDAVITWSIEE